VTKFSQATTCTNFELKVQVVICWSWRYRRSPKCWTSIPNWCDCLPQKILSFLVATNAWSHRPRNYLCGGWSVFV